MIDGIGAIYSSPWREIELENFPRMDDNSVCSKSEELLRHTDT